MLRLSAPAKINLSLKVLGRREDGYHILDSLVAFADIGDQLILEKAENTNFGVSGPFAVSAGEDNLVRRAHAALEAHIGAALPCRMALQKNLPIAAGLGGGSADAAATLRGLKNLFELDEAALLSIAEKLGADVPVCLDSAPAMMGGIGHDVERLADLPPFDIVLVNPRQTLKTADVFAALSLNGPNEAMAPPNFDTAAVLLDFVKQQGNDLQAVACRLVPDIHACLAALDESGFAYSAMSGSGASCFGLCTPGSGHAMAARYRTLREKDWVVAGRLIGAGDTKIDKTD
jgi:4-diphosphocytidyl-2-C-methyl-D-erythritol kinase